MNFPLDNLFWNRIDFSARRKRKLIQLYYFALTNSLGRWNVDCPFARYKILICQFQSVEFKKPHLRGKRDGNGSSFNWRVQMGHGQILWPMSSQLKVMRIHVTFPIV